MKSDPRGCECAESSVMNTWQIWGPDRSAKQCLRHAASHWEILTWRRKVLSQCKLHDVAMFRDFGSIHIIVTDGRTAGESRRVQVQSETAATAAAVAAYDDRAISVRGPATCCTPLKSTLCNSQRHSTRRAVIDEHGSVGQWRRR